MMKTVTVRPTTAGDELVYMANKERVLVRDQAGCTFAIVQVDEADVEAWSLGNNPDSWQMIGGQGFADSVPASPSRPTTTPGCLAVPRLRLLVKSGATKRKCRRAWRAVL